MDIDRHEQQEENLLYTRKDICDRLDELIAAVEALPQRDPATLPWWATTLLQGVGLALGVALGYWILVHAIAEGIKLANP